MSTASTSTRPPTQVKRSHVALAAALILFLLLGIIAFITFTFGIVWGQEFNPFSFNRREFVFREIPLIKLQVTPIHRNDTTNSLEAYLVSQKILPKPTTGSGRWDLVTARRGVSDRDPIVSQGDARILCEYLDTEDKSKNVWLDWTEKNVALAKILWPAVAKIAQQELYVFIPDLFALARNATDPQQFQRDLDQLLANKYLTFGQMQQQLENHRAALELFDEALVYAPDDAGVKAAREKSASAQPKILAEAEPSA